MEKERAKTGVGFLVYKNRSGPAPLEAAPLTGSVFGSATRGFAPIIATAVLSVVVLLAVVGWEITATLREKQESSSFIAVKAEDASGTAAKTGEGESAASTSTDLAYIAPAVLGGLIDAYVQMRDDGTYTEGGGKKAAEALAPAVRAPIEYRAYQTSDLSTDPDTSYARMLSYRSDLRDALAPLLKNTQPEYEIFALYADSKDPKYLERLREISGYYLEAQEAAARVVVPRDATPYHIAVVNALGEFAATLEQLAGNADDPFASVALLRTYNEGEADVLTSFSALTTYYKGKTI